MTALDSRCAREVDGERCAPDNRHGGDCRTTARAVDDLLTQSYEISLLLVVAADARDAQRVQELSDQIGELDQRAYEIGVRR